MFLLNYYACASYLMVLLFNLSLVAQASPTMQEEYKLFIKPSFEQGNYALKSFFRYTSTDDRFLVSSIKKNNINTIFNRPLTLKEVIFVALQNNQEIENARVTIEEFKARLTEQESKLYPSLDIDSRLNHKFFERQSTDFSQGFKKQVAASSRETTGIFNVSLRYDIYTGGEREGRIRKAEREIRNRQLQLEQIAEQIRFEATDNYYLLQNADAEVAIAQADVENATQTLRDARLLERAGLGTKFDVLRADGDLATANEQLARTVAKQRIAIKKLTETLNLGQKIQLSAADNITELGYWKLSLEETIVQAYKNRAELEQQLIQVEIGKQDRRIAIAEIIPKLDIIAQYGFNDEFEDALGALINYRFETRLRWRLFDGGWAFAGVKAAERRIDQANIQFADLRSQIRFEVEEAYYNLIANKGNIESTRKNITTREEGLRLARLRFQAGIGVQSDVIDAQRDLSKARGDFLQAIIEYNRSINLLQRAVSNFPDSLLFKRI